MTFFRNYNACAKVKKAHGRRNTKYLLSAPTLKFSKNLLNDPRNVAEFSPKITATQAVPSTGKHSKHSKPAKYKNKQTTNNQQLQCLFYFVES